MRNARRNSGPTFEPVEGGKWCEVLKCIHVARFRARWEGIECLVCTFHRNVVEEGVAEGRVYFPIQSAIDRVCQNAVVEFVAIQIGILPLPDYWPVGQEVACPRCATCFSLCAKSCQWANSPDRCRFVSVACAKLRCDLAVACCGRERHCLLEFADVSGREALPPTQ
jgi:hypothetical protein